MKVFESFPENTKCPICNTSEDKDCLLIPINGTSDGKQEQAIPIHAQCLAESSFRLEPNAGVVYTILPEQDAPIEIIPQKE